MGHFTFWISPFAQRNRYIYTQPASRSKFILIVMGIYMSSNYYYTKGESSDADE